MNLNNNKGGMTIVFLVMLSSVFVVMMGVAGVKLLEAAKNLRKHNMAFNYLVAMEELGQAVSRARSLGRNSDCLVNSINPSAAPTVAQINASCPAGTNRHPIPTLLPTTRCPGHPVAALQVRNQYTLCVPDRNLNGIVDPVEFCTQIAGLNYCLSGGGLVFDQNLQRLDLTNEVLDHGRPGPYVELGGGSTQQTNGGALLPRNNQEFWSPVALWPDNNEIYTTDCQNYTAANNSRYWLGCHYCDDPRNECWVMRMCPPTPGVPGPGRCPPGGLNGPPPAQQRIVLYFENNRPN